MCYHYGEVNVFLENMKYAQNVLWKSKKIIYIYSSKVIAFASEMILLFIIVNGEKEVVINS